jgi:hypothetical protein
MKVVLFNFMPQWKAVTIGTHGFSLICVHMSPKLHMCLFRAHHNRRNYDSCVEGRIIIGRDVSKAKGAVKDYDIARTCQNPVTCLRKGSLFPLSHVTHAKWYSAKVHLAKSASTP